MGCVGKMIFKVLAERQKLVIASIIGVEQSAFVKRRNIIDEPLIVNEIITWAKVKKKEIFLFKVDFEKAFDNLNWGYLLDVLKQMGFGETWCGWIKGDLNSTEVSVLVNGSLTSTFKLEKGVRQGDPLSPYLFIVSMEGLTIAIKEATTKRLIKGVELPKMGPKVTNFHYTDDTFLIGVWKEQYMKNLMLILICLHMASGLRINSGKSTMTGIGVPDQTIERMATELRCKARKLPFTYLGLPIGRSMTKVSSWNIPIDKFTKKTIELERENAFHGR